MIPLHDDNPHHGSKHVTIGLIVVCVLVFLYQMGLGEQAQHFVLTYGAIPGYLFDQFDHPLGVSIPAELTLITSMFLHGGFMHLIGNMLYLWIFGDNVEHAMGHGRFLVFYLLCGLAAALTHAALSNSPEIPMIGASGAISGVLGAYFLLYPKANVRVLIWIAFYVSLLNIPAFWVLGFWFVKDLLLGLVSMNATGGGVAFWAHVGGFIAGMVLVKLFIKNDEHILHARESGPWEMKRIKKAEFKSPWDRS